MLSTVAARALREAKLKIASARAQYLAVLLSSLREATVVTRQGVISLTVGNDSRLAELPMLMLPWRLIWLREGTDREACVCDKDADRDMYTERPLRLLPGGPGIDSSVDETEKDVADDPITGITSDLE